MTLYSEPFGLLMKVKKGYECFINIIERRSGYERHISRIIP